MKRVFVASERECLPKLQCCASARPYLCRTVDPAARGATVLLGERLDAPTLVALAAGPGCMTG